MNRLACWILSTCWLTVAGGTITSEREVLAQETATATPRDYATRLENVFAKVEERFYRDPFESPNYLGAKQEARTAVVGCRDPQQFSVIINQYLRALDASHTYYLTSEDWEYYHIAAIFESLPSIQELFQRQPLEYPSIGIIAQKCGQQWVVADVLPGGPAAASGVQIGDMLLKVNDQPYTPVAGWWSLVDQPATLTIQRGGQQQSLHVTARKVHPGDEMYAALTASMTIVERSGTKIGYAHFYSYAGRRYQEALEQAIQSGELRKADVLVLDLRYGLGGADANYLSLFNRDVPELLSIGRDGETSSSTLPWRKPVVMLINETSRSGKEVLAYGAKRHGLATLVGTRTAGAVLAGSPLVVDGEDLLWLAVRDIKVDGQRLEKIGVDPHLEVPMDPSTCQGVDVQREAALEEAVRLAQPKVVPPRPSP
ncbi:MAG: PDZ domain-containing protein [Planctomycetaceae bacterium]|nr:PDZ domain-containing protein [Planctomycetaceae bacterium]